MLMLEVNGNALKPHSLRYLEIDWSPEVLTMDPPADNTALVLQNDVNVQELEGHIQHYDAIILTLLAFTDGRAYSQARNLRERLNYKGRVIVRGEVLADQVLFMARCGIDTIEINGNDASAYENALSEFSAFYQPSADLADPVWRLRKKQKSVAA